MKDQKIGEWGLQAADIGNEISAEYVQGDDNDTDYITIQNRAMEIMGGDLSPDQTWGEWADACKQAAKELYEKWYMNGRL